MGIFKWKNYKTKYIIIIIIFGMEITLMGIYGVNDDETLN